MTVSACGCSGDLAPGSSSVGETFVFWERKWGWEGEGAGSGGRKREGRGGGGERGAGGGGEVGGGGDWHSADEARGRKRNEMATCGR